MEQVRDQLKGVKPLGGVLVFAKLQRLNIFGDFFGDSFVFFGGFSVFFFFYFGFFWGQHF